MTAPTIATDANALPSGEQVELLTSVIETQRELMSIVLDLGKVMQLVSERSRTLTGADAGVVEMAEGDEMVYRAAAGTAASLVGLRLKRSASLSGQCVVEARALLCEDTETDSRVDREACRLANARSMVVAPLLHDRTTVGVLKVLSARPGTFGLRQVELLEMMAGFVSAALVHAAARDALRLSEEELRLTFEMAPIGMAIVGLEGRWLRVNAALCRNLRYSAEALKAMTFQQITHPDDLDADLALLRRVLRGEIETYSFPKRYIRGDGELAHTELHVSLARGRSGEPLHFVVEIEDVTARKQAEARLALADRLASTGTLASGIAHEINNPLTSVMTNLEFLAEHVRELEAAVPPLPVARQMAELVDDARVGAERVRIIVRDLQAFSRTDGERRESLQLVPLLELSINMVFNEIRHRARFLRDYRPTPLVVGDDARLSQVFINLLVNATQSIVEGNANRNEICVATFTDASGRAVVEVRDTGKGIDAGARTRIFDPFFTTKPVGVGTGLGLSICHGIVAQHGGEIWVEATGPKGTSFRVALPPAPVPAAPESARSAPLRGSARSASLASVARRGRVLVVDDDAAAARSVVRVLSSEHDLVELRSGREALTLLALDDSFDLVLCDLMMPEMTGMELYDELSRRGLGVLSRMVFMTGGAFTPSARAFLERLTTPWIEKPFDSVALRTLVRTFVR